MIQIIHGDDILSSRKFFLDKRQQATNVHTLDGVTVTLTDLMQAFSGSSLFGSNENFFIEDLLSKRKSSKEVDELIDFLQTQQDTFIVLWESKLISPKQLKTLEKASVQEFKIPVVVFSFLDNLRPNNTTQLIRLYHEILIHQDAQYVLTMLLRQVRILLALSDPSEQTISEVAKLAPWQKGKLHKQAQLFSLKHLRTLHEKLFALEYGQKTGTLSLPVSEAIDFFLTSI